MLILVCPMILIGKYLHFHRSPCQKPHQKSGSSVGYKGTFWFSIIKSLEKMLIPKSALRIHFHNIPVQGKNSFLQVINWQWLFANWQCWRGIRFQTSSFPHVSKKNPSNKECCSNVDFMVTRASWYWADVKSSDESLHFFVLIPLTATSHWAPASLSAAYLTSPNSPDPIVL